MIFSELNQAQNEMLDILRKMSLRGCAPSGYPAVMPMWRTDSGVEDDDESSEARAVRHAMAKLKLADGYGHQLITKLAAGQGVDTGDWPAAAQALDSLDAWVEESLSG